MKRRRKKSQRRQPCIYESKAKPSDFIGGTVKAAVGLQALRVISTYT